VTSAYIVHYDYRASQLQGGHFGHLTGAAAVGDAVVPAKCAVAAAVDDAVVGAGCAVAAAVDDAVVPAVQWQQQWMLQPAVLVPVAWPI
jgi:hypothetical protein